MINKKDLKGKKDNKILFKESNKIKSARTSWVL